MTEAFPAELAPGGRLRAGMNTGNVLFTTQDPATGALSGVSVDLMNELARRLGVPLELVVYATPGQVADEAASGKWDVAMLAIEQGRAQAIDFSPPMTELDATFLVPAGSKLRDASEVDVPGVRIAVQDKAGYEPVLTRAIRQATLVRGRNNAETQALFAQQGLEALSGLKPNLIELAGKLPGARVLEGRFTAVNHGLGVPRGRDAAARYIRAFVEEMKASGFVARALERHRVPGVTALPR